MSEPSSALVNSTKAEKERKLNIFSSNPCLTIRTFELNDVLYFNWHVQLWKIVLTNRNNFLKFFCIHLFSIFHLLSIHSDRFWFNFTMTILFERHACISFEIEIIKYSEEAVSLFRVWRIRSDRDSNWFIKCYMKKGVEKLKSPS